MPSWLAALLTGVGLGLLVTWQLNRERNRGRTEGIRTVSPGTCAAIHRHRERATPRWIYCDRQRGHLGDHRCVIARNETVEW